jgi:hypothetical protein
VTRSYLGAMTENIWLTYSCFFSFEEMYSCIGRLGKGLPDVMTGFIWLGGIRLADWSAGIFSDKAQRGFVHLETVCSLFAYDYLKCDSLKIDSLLPKSSAIGR